MKKIIVSLLFVLVSFIVMGQRALIEKNTYTIRAGFFGTNYNSVYDNDGEKKITPDILHSGFYVDAEAGIHKHWNVLINAPILIYNQAESSDAPGGYKDRKKISKPGDIELGLKYGLERNDQWDASFSLIQSLGTGYRDNTSNLNTGFSDYYTKAFFNVRYHPSTRWSAEANTGFNNRNKEFGDEFYAGVFFRFILRKSIILEWAANGVLPLENASENPQLYLFGLYHNNWGLLNTGIDISYVNQQGIGFFSGISFPIKGQYIYSSPVIRLGVLLSFKKSLKNEK